MLNLRFFGTFHVAFVGGREPSIDTAKTKALLAYLATESGCPHLREQLAAMFWPEADQKAALQSVRQALYTLKRQLQPQPELQANASPYLTITRQDVSFNFDSEHWIDVEVFAALLQSTQQHAHRQLDACPECIARLADAVSLYHGPFLSGLTLPDADSFEEWRLAREEWYRAQVVRSLGTLATYYERRREFSAAQQHLMRLLELEPWDEGAHRRLIKLYAADGQRTFAVQQFENMRRVLAQGLGVEPSLETIQLIQGIQHGSPPDERQEDTSPYKGLYPFSLSDSADFFGQEDMVRALVATLDREPAVVLIGASGSGKSSLVRAGLLPTLLHPGKPVGRNGSHRDSLPVEWAVLELRPGSQPFHALAEAIARTMREQIDIDELAQRMSLEGASLPAMGLLPANKRTLIFADQFEELYTLCASATVRRTFIEFILRSVDDSVQLNYALSLLIAMRADFVGQFLTYRALTDVLQRGGMLLKPMGRADLARAIGEPARNRGVFFEPGLVERLLDDVGEEPGNLPLLQFALSELWTRREGWQIAHEAYDEIGRVDGSLAAYADDVYTRLEPAEQISARKLFVQLVQPGEATGDTRRPALRSELDEATWQLAHKLADLRLVVTGRDSEGESVELVHEALIRSWGQLREWMDEDRTFRRWQQRLRTFVQQWIASGREEDALLRGVLLAEAENWAGQRRLDLSASEQEYIDASVQARNQKLAEAERAQKLELERAQALATAESQRAEAEHLRAESEHTASRRLRWLTIGLASVLVVALVAAGFALWQQRQAGQFAQQALARQLAAQAVDLSDDSTELAILLSEEAQSRMSDPVDIRSFLLSFEVNALLERFFQDGSGDMTEIAVDPDSDHMLVLAGEGDRSRVLRWDLASGAFLGELLTAHAGTFAPDGSLVATISEDGIQLWDGERGEEVAAWNPDPEHDVNQLLFSADGEWLLSKTKNADITFWDVDTQEAVHQFKIPDSSEVTWLSPDKRTLAVTQDVGDERGVDLWDVETGQKTGIRLGGHTSTITSVAFSPDSSTVATSSFDGTVRTWDAATGEQLHTPFADHEGRVLTALFSPDGRTLATGGADRRILLYDIESGKRIGAPLIGHDNWVRSLRFDPAGDALYSGATGGNLIRWDLSRRKSYEGHNDRVRSLALSPDGSTLATSGFDKRILLWDAATGEQFAELPPLHERSIIQTAFSPDGRYLATADAGGAVALWDVAARELLHPPLMYQENVVIGLTFSPDSKYLAVGDFNGNISLWEVASGTLVQTADDAHDGWALALAFSPDGQTLVSGGTDGKIRFWDTSALGQAGQPAELAARGEPIAAHDYWVTSLLYTGDGDTLISGSADATVRFWDTSTGAEEGEPITGQKSQVWGVDFYPPHGEETLVVLGNNGGVRLWDVESRTPLGPGLTTALETEAFQVDPAGEYVYLGSFDKRVERWPLDPLTWRERGCATAQRSLTEQEWQQYLKDTPYAPVCPEP